MNSSKLDQKDSSTEAASKPETNAKSTRSKLLVNLYIGSVAVISFVSLVALWRATIPLQDFATPSGWISLVVICVLIAMSEWFSVNLYFRKTAVSTSAIPILVGYLLFGPIGIFVVSLTVALVLWLKHHSPINRFFFNFGNHLLSGALCL